MVIKIEDVKNYIKKFKEDGCVVIPDFVSEKEINELKDACRKIVDDIDMSQQLETFTTIEGNSHVRGNFFGDSQDKMSPFFEEGVVDNEGQLVIPKHQAVNKIAHAIHWLNPTFKKHTFSEKVKNVARELGMIKPIVPQGMYIFKNPGVGGEFAPHQDGTFLYSEPMTTLGFWWALDDATIENGCLWFIPGSHKGNIKRRMLRNPDMSDPDKLYIYDHPLETFENEDFVPAVAPKGSCVLIDGRVVHRSAKNNSTQPRHAYTFHLYDGEESVWPKENWQQETTNYKFPTLYDN